MTAPRPRRVERLTLTPQESAVLLPHALEVLKLTGGAGPFDDVVFDLPVDLRASLVAAIDQIVKDRGLAWPGYFAGWEYKDDVLSVTVY